MHFDNYLNNRSSYFVNKEKRDLESCGPHIESCRSRLQPISSNLESKAVEHRSFNLVATSVNKREKTELKVEQRTNLESKFKTDYFLLIAVIHLITVDICLKINAL
jgi:hypothetical protein